MSNISWYKEFVNFNYKPKKDDIICLFRFEPAKKISKIEAMGRIASESSCGTWTTLALMPKGLNRLKAHAFWEKNNFVKVAYPLELFEKGSIPNFLSGPAGNIFGMKAVKNLRILDAKFPLKYLKNFKGPNYGTNVIKKIFKRKKGPITSVVAKPKLGWSAREHAERIGYPLWIGGIDAIKDDENLTNQKFNRFSKRVQYLAKYRDKAEKKTGDVKEAFINVTSPNFKELEKRIKLVHNYGFKYFMIDVVLSGFTAVQTAVELAHDLKMVIHGHRAMHAMFTRNKKHGMSMLLLAKLMRIIGIDQLHIGTVIGKMSGEKKEILAIKDMIMSKKTEDIPFLRLEQNWGRIKPMLPVASGGLHAGILPELFNIYGTTDIVIQVGGGTLALGPYKGAKAVIQAIEAYHKGINLKDYAKTHTELRDSLKKFGYIKPL
jgi:ribulose-bisphosphate carboxylase large chain